jgi:hypothetical protein
VFELARIMGTSARMIERHSGALLDGAGAGIAEALDALDAQRDEAAQIAISERLRSRPTSPARCRGPAGACEAAAPYLPAPQPPSEDRWLTTREAAAYLGMSPNALHKLAAARSVRFVQDTPRGRCYFKRSWLDDSRER